MDIKVKGIARYPHVVKASSAKDADKLQYSISILIHKSDDQCMVIDKSLNEAILNKYPKGEPAKFGTCWKDCAIEEPQNELLKDYMSLKLSTNADIDKPPVVDSSIQPIIDPSFDNQLAGKIVWVTGGIGCYERGGNHGVKVYLNGTLDTGDMGDLPRESFSSKPTAEQMFSDVAVNSPSTVPSPAPPTASPVYQMTAKASGASRDQFVEQGWTDESLIKEGYMLSPIGVSPSFT